MAITHQSDPGIAEEIQYDRILEIYNHIGEQERHFNELERSYRVLASQWLLASLGAIGYLLQSDKIVLFDKNMLIGLIGIAGNTGVFLLWLIDIRVYHKLLNCAFLQGIRLEQENNWLPKVRTDMLLSQETGDVVKHTGMYYICSCILLQIISIIGIAGYFYFNKSYTLMISAIIIGILLINSQVNYMRKEAINPRAKKLYKLLKNTYNDEIFITPAAKQNGDHTG